MKFSVLVALAAALLVLLPPTTPGATAAAATAGRSGTGIALGEIPTPRSPVGHAMYGKVTTAVANLPNRVSDRRFAKSLRKLTRRRRNFRRPDFVLLNEVSGRSIETMRVRKRRYDAYRDPVTDPTPGGVQSLNNVVMWHARRWSLLDGGRVKLVEDDQGYHAGRPFTWDRYATWAVLQRRNGAIVSVVSTHMMTNPGRFPRQHGDPPMSRKQQYGRGMRILVELVDELAARGPVLVGGDMNSHRSQGGWSAPVRMDRAGYEYAKNRGVLYLFHQDRTTVRRSRQVRVASHHPALLSTVALRGQGPS